MKTVKHHASVLFVCVAAVFSHTGRADVLTSSDFHRWGGEVMSRIEDGMSRWDGLYNNSPTQTWPDAAWGQGVMSHALAAAAKVDSSYLQRAKDQADEFHLRYWCYQNGVSGYNSGYGSCGDRYYDDNAWIALALFELYELTNDSKYLGWSEDTVAFSMSGENGPGDSPEGGIRWHESDTSGASVCSTAPTCLANLLIYRSTGIESYRTDGLRLYDWLIEDSGLQTAAGLFHETAQGALGYLTGVVVQAALRLYEITSDEGYLKEAQRMAIALEGEMISGSTRALTQYGRWGGHDMTNAFVELYKIDGNTHWLDVAAGYLEYLYVNGKDGASGFYPERWEDISGAYSESLIDNASVARALWKMADTPGGHTPFDHYAERLVGRWMLDESTGTVASDSSGFDSGGDLNGVSFSFDSSSVAGKWNGGLNFDGSDDHIEVPDGFENFRAGMTVSVWAYPTAVKGWARFIDFGNGEYDNNIVFGRHMSTNNLFFEAYDNTSSGGQVIASGAIQLNQWQMFTATLDASGNVILYKNGTQVATGTTALPSNLERVNNYIGRSNWDADSYYQGRMDDVRIYNYALSPEQVQRLYLYGGQAENPTPSDMNSNELDIVDLEWTAGSLAVEHDVYIGTNKTAVTNATTTNPEYIGRQSGTTFAPSLTQDTTYYWRVDEVTASDTIAKGRVWSFDTYVWPISGLIAHYTMDNDFISGSTLIDTSGSPYNSGTIYGPATGAAGKVGQSLNFDGTNDYVDMQDGFDDFTSGMTISVWAYPTAAPFWARFVDIGNGSANNSIVFARSGTTNTLSFEAYVGSVTGGTVQAPNAIELNKWQMFTATLYPCGYAVLYKNGVRIQGGQTGIPLDVTRVNNYIGKSNWSDPYYKGRMDDLAVWNRTLTTEEIEAIYRRGMLGHSFDNGVDPDAPVAYWQFNENAGSIVGDVSGNNLDGQLVNMDQSGWVRGKQCGGLEFDGTDDYVEIADFKGITGQASRSCTAWIKTTKVNGEIFSWGDYTQQSAKWIVRVNSDGTLRTEVQGRVYIRRHCH